MATKTRKKTTSRNSGALRDRGSLASPRKKSAPKGEGRFGSFVLPFFLSFCILICLGALGFIGYRTVTASDFFHVEKVDVRGTHRSSKTDIERIVNLQTERSGVWNADLPEMRQKIEKLSFVRSAAVSRILPNGIRVVVDEHVPQAIVRTNGGDYLVSEDGTLLARAEKAEANMPFVMLGWDETKSEKAGKDNLERLKTYRTMLTEWQQFDLASRVRFVDLSNMRELRAVTEDSGQSVSIELGRDNFGEHLKRGINAIVGKGNVFQAVNLVGANMQLEPRSQNRER
ncbi:MAG TPA: FtsQ-type POTRA domain-containing protein [Pyrinomonadaceae bacterium]|nr:FtsQ-type POTRA domain-containing protein [Pyrinomonadaceae bacterium]